MQLGKSSTNKPNNTAQQNLKFCIYNTSMLTSLRELLGYNHIKLKQQPLWEAINFIYINNFVALTICFGFQLNGAVYIYIYIYMWKLSSVSIYVIMERIDYFWIYLVAFLESNRWYLNFFFFLEKLLKYPKLLD